METRENRTNLDLHRAIELIDSETERKGFKFSSILRLALRLEGTKQENTDNLSISGSGYRIQYS